MARRSRLVFVAISFTATLTIAAALFSSSPYAGISTGASASPTSIASIGTGPDGNTLGSIPAWFEPEQGSGEGASGFVARGRGYAIAVRPDGAWLAFPNHDRTGTALHLQWLGSSGRGSLQGEGQLQSTSNYIRGNDRSKWRHGVPQFAQVRRRGLYPGVDLIFRSVGQSLEYDLVVAPGADPSPIKFRIDGAPGQRIDPNGDLVLQTTAGEIRHHKPRVFQRTPSGELPLHAIYVLSASNEVSIRLGAFDPAKEIIIDPVLSYSTFLGGSNTDGIYHLAMAVDRDGYAYVTGETISADFPVKNALDDSCGTEGTCNAEAVQYPDSPPSIDYRQDIFVTKLNRSGTGLIYSTYIGGAADDQGHGIAVDAAGDAYITGYTDSGDGLAGSKALAQCTDPLTFGHFTLKLGATGSNVLYAVRCIGGDKIAVDANGNAYVAGVESNNYTTTSGSFQPTRKGETDAYVSKLNATGTGLSYSTFLGGSSFDNIGALVVDADGAAYVSGATYSSDFPTTNGAYRSTFPVNHPNGSTNTYAAIYVSKLTPSGSSLDFSTFVWSGNVGGLALDGSKNIYVAGTTTVDNFPTTAGVFQPAMKPYPFCCPFDVGVDGYVAKLSPSATSLIYATYLGGTYEEYITGLAVANGRAYVSGWSSSSDLPVTRNGFQRVPPKFDNGFVADINSTATQLSSMSYLGGSATDHIEAMAGGPPGTVYVAGWTGSTDFPTTLAAFQTSNHGTIDVTVSKIIPLCTLNTTLPSVTICKPSTNSTSSSPVTIVAGSNDTEAVRLMQVYVDGSKVYESALSAIDVKLKMRTGTHRIAVQAINTSGVTYKKIVYVTVN